MAALLRHRASRMGGSVIQRTQAAVTSPTVAQEGRRLVPRRMYSTEEVRGGIEREIEQKKDELYDLLAKAEQNVRTSSFRNSQLLLHLSEEVTPRPKEYFWCKLKSSSSGISALKKIRVYVLGLAAVDCVIRYERHYEEKKAARAMMIKKEHEARSRLMEN